MIKNVSKHGSSSFDKEYYQRFFANYSKREFDAYHRWFLGWHRFLARHIPISNAKGRVLEIGCSAGHFARILTDNGFEVTATDISSYILRKARKIHKDIVFRKLDVTKKIEIPGTFDFTFAFEVLEHLENPEKALKNVKTKLKKGGSFVFSTPFPTKRAFSDPTHINVHNEKWWLSLGRKTGYSKVKVIHASFIPFLYKFSAIFSHGFPIKTNIPYINSTAFYVFEK